VKRGIYFLKAVVQNMKKSPLIFIFIALIAGLLIGYGIGQKQQRPSPQVEEQKQSTRQKEKTTVELTPIRIGWQTGWAPQAQLAQVLKHTDILEQNELKGEFKGFSYGGPQAEAALAGEIDVFFAGDFPAINLMTKTEKWSIISRFMDVRAGIIVPKNSPTQSLTDLRDKVIAGPFVSGTYVHVLKILRDNGFDPVKNFKWKNLDILEESSLIQKGTDESWGEIDGFISWDPTMAIVEEIGKARILQLITPITVTAMSNDFITQHPVAAKNFLRAFIESYLYYAQHQDQANQWFADETKFEHPFSVIDRMAELEKNLKAKNLQEIDIKLYDSHLTTMQAIADEAGKSGLITKTLNVKERVNQQLLEEAMDELKK
jgi:ABC-type nitrate/sulfonate/bicarbonate transport system substrate-binding protein